MRLLENTNSEDEVEVYISAYRGTEIDFPVSGSTQQFNIKSVSNRVSCYVELKFPGGVTIPKLTFNYEGDKVKDTLFYDYKDNYKWESPLIITELEFTVSDSYPNIFIENAHEVETLTVKGNFCACNFKTMKIGSMIFEVSLGYLNVLQNKKITANSVTVMTPYGTHCVAGATLNIGTDTNCPDAAARGEGIIATEVPTDSSTFCTSTMFACSEAASSCPTSGTAPTAGQGDFSITLDDGPVQFLIDGSSTASISTYGPDTDTLSISTQNLIRENKADFEAEPGDARMYLYETVSPNYSRMWVHSSSKEYIEARPWLISLLSVGLLKPSYLRHTLVHIPRGECPYPSADSFQTNALISKRIESLSYIDASFGIAQNYGNTFYEYFVTTEGDYIRHEIVFTGNNYFIQGCLAITILIAAYAIFLVFFNLIRYKKNIERIYITYLLGMRRLGKSKQVNTPDSNKIKTKQAFVQQSKVKMLKVGVFHSRYIYAEEKNRSRYDKFSISSMLKRGKSVQLSFFKAIDLYMEYQSLKRTNSWRLFFSEIYAEPSYFTKDVMESEDKFEQVSVRMDLLTPKYLKFCTLRGVKPLPIEDQKLVLKEYKLQLRQKDVAATSAYLKIRWKTPLEKAKMLEKRRIEKSLAKATESEVDDHTSIERFLYSEIMSSSFNSDYVLVEDMVNKYHQFCEDSRVEELLRANIVGSSELEKFGAEFKEDFYVPYIKGIALRAVPSHQRRKHVNGLTRVPQSLHTSETSMFMSWILVLKSDFYKLTFSDVGIVYNFLVNLLNMIFILAIPFLIMIPLTWSLMQYHTINSDIYAHVFVLYDVFNGSSYEFWLNELPMYWIWFGFLMLSLVFIFFAFIELISFYATGARDTGKYPVVRTWAKWIISFLFWLLFFIFLAIYTAYISVILVWCILGAILNPNEFLPIATAAAVIIGFILIMYSRVKYVHENLNEVVSLVVNEQLKMSLIETLEKDQSNMAKLLESPIDKFHQAAFHKAINVFMDVNNLPKVERNITDQILEGDGGAIAKLLNSNLGIDYNLGVGIVGLLREDPSVILDSVYRLSKELNLNPDISVLIAQVAVEQLNTDVSGAKTQGALLLAFKTIFRKAFPKFQLETLDLLLQIVVEMDIKPFEVICQKLDIPQSLLQLTIAVVNRDDVLLESAAIKLSRDLLHTPYHLLFTEVYRLAKGNLRGDLTQLSKMLNIPHPFLLRVVIALAKDDKDMLRNAVFQSISEIATRIDSEVSFADVNNNPIVKSTTDTAREAAKTVQNHLMALSTIATGVDINMHTLVEDSIKEIDADIAGKVFQAAQGGINGIDIILDRLGHEHQKKIIIEFAHVLIGKRFELTEICRKLGILPSESEVLYSTIGIILLVAKHTHKVRLFRDIEKHKEKIDQRKLSELSKYIEEREVFSEKIKRRLDELISKKYINEDKILNSTYFRKFKKNTFGKLKISTLLSKGSDIFQQKAKIIADEISKNIANNDLGTVQMIVENIMKEIFKSLGFTKEMKAYFISITVVAIYFINNAPQSENIDEELAKALRLVAAMLDISENHLTFIIDILSGNPYRIFQ